MKAYLGHYSGLPLACWKAIAIGGVISVVTGLVSYLSIYLTTLLHFSVSQSGAILSFYGVGNIIGGFLGGKLADRYSSRGVSLAGATVMAMSFFFLPHLTTPLILMVCLFIIGMAFSGYLTAMNVMILGYCQQYSTLRMKALNVIASMSNFGIGLSALLITLCYKIGFHFIFNLAALLLLVSIGGLFTLPARQPTVAPVTAAQHIATLAVSRINPSVLGLVLTCVFGIGIIIAQSQTTYPLYLHSSFAASGISAVTFLLAINPIMIVFLQNLVVGVFSATNKVLLMGSGAFIMGFGMWLLSFATWYSLAIVACVIYTLGEMLFFSPAQWLCYESRPHKKGSSLGWYRTFYSLGRAVGPTIGGFSYHYWGSHSVWQGCGLIGLLCLAACYGYNRMENNENRLVNGSRLGD